MKDRVKLLTILGIGFTLGSPAFGATVGAGTFNLSGTAVGTTNGIDFYLISPGDQTGSVNLPTSGVFADLVPASVQTIMNLTSTNGVTPGSAFNFQNWIRLSDGINLDATSIPIPSLPICPASGVVAVGYQCLVNGASPVILTQSLTGVGARINIYGEAHYNGDSTLTPFNAFFAAPTTSFVTIADFETYFDTNHAIPAVSYAASFTTGPEPGVGVLTSFGLIGLYAWKKRRDR